MEMEEMQQLSKRSRVGHYETPRHHQARQVEGDGDDSKASATLRAWQQDHASRICRVSRSSGGKDRHSKVLTAKGLRDRRVRLSVSTAIQFYDLQDRLGYDQPSKAVEWLIKAASAAIADLPSLDAAFPDLESQLMGFRRGDSGRSREEDEEALQQHLLSLEKSACSSTSETSKGSALSLSRSDSRARARERAKERTATYARDKEQQDDDDDDDDDDDAHNISDGSFHHSSMNRDHASFTDLLTGGRGTVNHNLVTIAHANSSTTPAGFMHKQILHFPPTATTDYFGQAAAAAAGQLHKPHHHSFGFLASQPQHFPHNPSMAIVPFNVTTAVAAAAPGTTATDHHHPDIQPHHLPFLQDNQPTAVAPGRDYNRSFSIRGTLQSNSSSLTHHLHHLQRLPTTVDGGSDLPFFFGVAGATATHATSASADNHFPAGFDGRLQFCYLNIKKDKN